MPYLQKWYKSMYNHEYYIKHMDKLKEQRQGVVFCDVCQKYISKINILKHNKRKYHNQLLENMHKRHYINKILNQKFEGHISSIVASYLF